MRLLEKILIEGIMPERALGKLQRAGICLYHVKKVKKNQILLSVNRKDAEKVFAICPDVCYNISVYSPYTAKSVGSESLLSLLGQAKARIGLFVGAAVFLGATLVCNRFVFKIEVTGAEVYRREVLAALEASGITPFSLYESGREQDAAAKILSLKDVSFCSVQKSGMTVRVDVRLNAFTEPSPVLGDMQANHSGTVLALAVLRGTPLKRAGDEVSAGEPLVGAYFESESGERVSVTAIARATLSCVYEGRVETDSEEEAFAIGYLAVDGEITEKSLERTENGYLVRIVYTVTETINF